MMKSIVALCAWLFCLDREELVFGPLPEGIHKN